MGSSIRLILGEQEAPAPKASQGPLKMGGEPDPKTLDHWRCDSCGERVRYEHLVRAVLVRGELWGYVHEGCLSATRAAFR